MHINLTVHSVVCVSRAACAWTPVRPMSWPNQSRAGTPSSRIQRIVNLVSCACLIVPLKLSV